MQVDSSDPPPNPDDANQIYRFLYDNLPDGLVGFDKNGLITMCTDRALEMFGYMREEVIGSTFDMFVTPDQREAAWKAFVEGIDRGHSLYIGVEAVGLRKDGTTFHFHINSTVVQENGNVTGYLSLVRDISERMRVLEALKTSEQRFRDMISSVPEGIAATDINENLIFVNEGFAKLVGYEVGELLGKSVIDLIASDEENKIREGTVSRKQGVPSSYDLTFIRRDGQKRLTRVSAAPWIDAAGTVIGTLAVVVDITERIKLESSLRESEERYRMLAEHVQDVIATTDMNLRFTYVSPSVVDLLGFEVDETLTKGIVDVLTPESLELVTNKLEEALMLEETVGKDGYEAAPLELRTYHKNGSTVWVEASRVFLRDDDDRPVGLLLVVRDITRRKMAENRLKTSLRELELYSSLLRHDIGNDLQIASGAIERVLSTPSDGSQFDKYISMAQASIERMVSLVTLADTRYSKPMDKLVNLVEQRALQAESAHPDLKVIVKADAYSKNTGLDGRRLLPLFFDNMFRNSSIHAGPTPKIFIDLRKVGGMIQIDIVDDGPNILPEIRDKIFQRGISTRGKGMGLYLSKRIIEGYGGTIELLESSPLARGAAFRTLLPIKETNSEN